MTTMIHRLALLAGTATLAACTSMGGSAPPAGPVFTLWSPAFKDGATLEQRHAGNVPTNPNCVGQNVAPPLACICGRAPLARVVSSTWISTASLTAMVTRLRRPGSRTWSFMR